MSILFKDIETGYKFPPVVQSYAQPAIDHYALASLDMNPVHTNEEWAARASRCQSDNRVARSAIPSPVRRTPCLP
ncbi:MAG: hypothetical protein K2X57_13800 [Xanthobacteraceae bacterium]|nr:hypothetical protein [Xanthobacteraceae bacterium]